jgi:KH domain
MEAVLRPRSLSEPPTSPAARDPMKHSPQGGDPVVDGQPASAGLDAAPDAAETAPTAPAVDAAAEPVASHEATAGPNGDAVDAAPVQQQPDGSGQEVPLHAEQQPAGEQQPVDAAAMAAAQAQAAVTAAALTQGAGALEQMLQIPGTMVGKLIGKQGETIKGLQYSTNTRIQVHGLECQLCE